MLRLFKDQFVLKSQCLDPQTCEIALSLLIVDLCKSVKMNFAI